MLGSGLFDAGMIVGWMDTWWGIGILIIVVIISWGVFWSNLNSAANDIEESVKNSDWNKARKEKKEIERLEREIKRKKLKDQLDDR